MKPIFIDTSFLLALAFKTDALNRRALGWQKSLQGPFITSEFVLLEVADGTCSPGIREYAEAIIRFARTDRNLTIIGASSELFDSGYSRFCRYRDKHWGLTDCISFEIMSVRGMSEALTHDRHFEQAGFRALLRDDPPKN